MKLTNEEISSKSIALSWDKTAKSWKYSIIFDAIQLNSLWTVKSKSINLNWNIIEDISSNSIGLSCDKTAKLGK